MLKRKIGFYGNKHITMAPRLSFWQTNLKNNRTSIISEKKEIANFLAYCTFTHIKIPPHIRLAVYNAIINNTIFPTLEEPYDTSEFIYRARLHNISDNYILSTRYNDFFRIAENTAYFSCAKPNDAGRFVPALLCEDPSYAILFTEDYKGNFQSRITLQFCLQTNSIIMYESYGNTNEKFIKYLLSKRFNVPVEFSNGRFNYNVTPKGKKR